MTIRLFVGDCRAKLAGLAPESVHCCVTSPPYWGLRDYGHAEQLGLEKTPDEFVAGMVEAFRAVHRVLRPDGTLWVNLGDSYATAGTRQGNLGGTIGNGGESSDARSGYRSQAPGLKPKDLCMIPARVALALQADGWYLRSVIIWNKPNPMPESVTDRPTTSHEYLYLFAKSETYFYDHEAIKEPQEDGERTRRLREQREGLDTTYNLRRDQMPGQERPGNTGSVRTAAARQRLAMLGTRNKRTVWTIASQPFKGAHFATFPPTLAETCILAGTSPQCCEYCHAPFERILAEPEPTGGEGSGNKERKNRLDFGGADVEQGRRQAFGVPWQPSISRTVGWRPSCEHDTAKGSARATVLDLFAGAGTTALVAERLGRDSVAVELNPEYAQIIRDRVTDECPLFTEIVEAADDAGVDR